MRNFFPIIIIAATIGLVYIYVWPQYNNLKTLMADGRNYDEILAKSAELRQIRENLREVIRDLPSAELDRLAKMIPAGSDNVQLILDVDNLARRRGIVLENFKSSFSEDEVAAGRGAEASPGASSLYNTMTLTFKFGASYENLLLFLRDLEDSLRIMDILSIKVKTDSERPTVQNYEMSLRTYWLKN